MLKIDLKFGVDKEKNLSFNGEQKGIILQSANKLQSIINSEEFKNEVLKHAFRRKKRFYKTRDSNQTVLNKILSGDDKFINENENDSNIKGDRDIDIFVTPYKAYRKNGDPKTGIVGKTNRTTYQTWINIFNLESRIKNYGDSPAVLESLVAQNLIHEYCHNLGYGHTKRGTRDKTNKYSVPYAIGSIVKKLIQQKAQDSEMIYIELAELEEIQPCSYNFEI